MDNYKTISKYGMNKSTTTNGGNNKGNLIISRFGFNKKTTFGNGNNKENLVVSRFGLNAPKYKEKYNDLKVSVKNLVVTRDIQYPPWTDWQLLGVPSSISTIEYSEWTDWQLFGVPSPISTNQNPPWNNVDLFSSVTT